jgi:hypothetical protein
MRIQIEKIVIVVNIWSGEFHWLSEGRLKNLRKLREFDVWQDGSDCSGDFWSTFWSFCELRKCQKKFVRFLNEKRDWRSVGDRWRYKGEEECLWSSSFHIAYDIWHITNQISRL